MIGASWYASLWVVSVDCYCGFVLFDINKGALVTKSDKYIYCFHVVIIFVCYHTHQFPKIIC